MHHKKSYNRDKLILEFWDRSEKLSINNKKYKNFVKKFLNYQLEEDIGEIDLTTNSLIKIGKDISARIIAKEDGIFAGVDEFKLLNQDLQINPQKYDGQRIKKGDVLIEIKGDVGKILSNERVSLNLLQRMSGIATLTNGLSKMLRTDNMDNITTKIAATRKTFWGFIDKKAVSIGHGLTHRLSLSDMILIKDNHLKISNCSIKELLDLAVSNLKSKSRFVEVEVENKKQALIAAKSIKKIKKKISDGNFGYGNDTLFAIMFDKIDPKTIKSSVEYFKRNNLYDYVLLEASGNINPENLINYKNCGVDIISMGHLTNYCKALNMSLELN